jgi:hypothetical protein
MQPIDVLLEAAERRSDKLKSCRKEAGRRPARPGRRAGRILPWSRATCPACKAELVYDPGKRTSSSGGEIPCPYLSLPFAELRAGHDQIYFGPWRKVEATQPDIRRAYNQLDVT